MDKRLRLVLAAMLLGVTSLAMAAGAPVAHCSAPCEVSLAGSWRFLPANLVGANQADPASRVPDALWRSIRVPANWSVEGFDISGVAWYRREFDAPAPLPQALTLLHFDGVDYFADVWLNGIYLGAHEGYFEPFAFDVSRSLRAGQRNELVVRVNSPVESPAAWSLRKRLIKGVFAHHDTRPGGAWSARGQDRNSGGIWNHVRLQMAASVALDAPRVRSREGAGGVRQASVTLGTWSAAAAASQRVDLKLEFTPHNFTGASYVTTRSLVIGAGRQEHVLDMTMAGAHAWWPHELGAPDLYRVRATLLRGTRVLDRSEVVTGLRDVRMDMKSQTWHINGRRLFLRGTNYIPTQWLSELGAADYRRDIELMRKANVNAVRVHAHVGDARFYAAADAAGLLVWQDFPLQWGYEDSAEFESEAKRQLGAMIRLLDSHPAIFAWSMHNEPPWDAWWMKHKYPDYDPNQNRQLDDRLEHEARQLDDSRYVHKASSSAEHQWQGWYSGRWSDFNKPTTHALVTEFGAQALPGIASMRRMFNDENIFPDTDKKLELWEYRNFQKDETFKNAGIAKGKDIHEFIANSQGYQARLTQLAVESLRRQKYAPVGAIFQFMFVENWPSMNWGVLDYWRQPKAGYFALARAYQPLLPSIQWDEETPAPGSTPRFGLWLVNDTARAYTALRYRWSLACGSAPLASGETRADVNADAVAFASAIVTPPLPKGACTLSVNLQDQSGTTVAENAYAFNVQ